MADYKVLMEKIIIIDDDKKPIKIQKSESSKGTQNLSIRKWYTDRDTGEVLPGKSGISFTLRETEIPTTKEILFESLKMIGTTKDEILLAFEPKKEKSKK